MNDIMEKIRREIDPDVNEPIDRLLEEAAAEIERLRTDAGELVVMQYELAAARTALREIANIGHNCRSVDIARAALSRT